jgi:hypothetical protein
VGLLGLGRLWVNAAVERWLRSAVPPEFGQDDWFARPRYLAHDAFEIRQIRQFILVAAIFVTAALGRVKMDFQEVQELSLSLWPEARVITNASPKTRRH